jgi:hypothetical protein
MGKPVSGFVARPSRCLKPPTRIVRLLDNVIASNVNPTRSFGPVGTAVPIASVEKRSEKT